MKLINLGAEAKISLDEGVITKDRIPKGYREDALDVKIRKARTKKEAKLLARAKAAGVMVPKVMGTRDFSIQMEFVDGVRVKDILDKANMKKICSDIGRSVAKLHGASIIHGDLTTSNMILFSGKVHLIDFGLGQVSDKVEDKATDLHLLEEAIESTHYMISSDALKIIFESYLKGCKDGKDVMKRLSAIRLRGRYMVRGSDCS
ncbi:MAG: Kae1-associated serine/threonine protein kinase [Nanohaloarchaea archaeon]|nr:Kae1-associated serine/threonine protein kinase [Candidatus Nanohaloarchaea archaeon]